LEGLESLGALGNAAAVPVIIFLTQIIKKTIGDFKYGSDLLAIGLSFILCTGWAFYDMTTSQYSAFVSLNGLGLFKWIIDQGVISFATWLAASKIYDLSHGNKKKEKEVSTKIEKQVAEKEKLQEELVKLKTVQGDKDEQPMEKTVVSDKLRAILGG
jgi:hypothetical protein